MDGQRRLWLRWMVGTRRLAGMTIRGERMGNLTGGRIGEAIAHEEDHVGGRTLHEHEEPPVLRTQPASQEEDRRQRHQPGAGLDGVETQGGANEPAPRESRASSNEACGHDAKLTGPAEAISIIDVNSVRAASRWACSRHRRTLLRLASSCPSRCAWRMV